MRTSHLLLGVLLAGCGATESQAHLAAQEREVRACAGISPEQARGPFVHHEDIVSVQPIVEPGVVASRNVGVRTIFHERRGVTPELVTREVACELARNATLGRPERGTEQFPEALPDVDVHVLPVTGGFAVDVTADRAADVAEALRRAQALAPTSR